MVKLRLKRMGSKRRAFYRIVAADSRAKRDGRFLETIGYYDPLKNPVDIKVQEEKAIKWMMNGAQLSDTVRSLLKQVGILAKVHQLKYGKNAEA